MERVWVQNNTPSVVWIMGDPTFPYVMISPGDCAYVYVRRTN